MTITTLVLGISLLYVGTLFVLSRRRRRPLLPPPTELLFVCIVPCLNEELVIGPSLDRLLALHASRFAVLVVDDGSSDTTAAVTRRYAEGDDRVWLLRRTVPHARQGKGAALNAGYRHLLGSGILRGQSLDNIVVGVVDADGRLAPDALLEVAPYFRDPAVGAVQIGVRMHNAGESLLTRLQDVEFVTCTQIFQRARQRLGSVGLGGNGQFTRLSALASLGERPWSDCLTEDLDLGIRLLAAGWSNAFCPTTHVSQQAVVSLRRLIRQRARWFQGHLQCIGRLPLILRCPLPIRPSMDLIQHLLSPVLVLLTSVLPAALLVDVGYLAYQRPTALGQGGGHVSALVLLLVYLLTFGLAPIFAYVYWLATPEVSLLRALAYAHLYSLYSYLWFPAGWRGVANLLRRRTGWAKTARSADVTTEPIPLGIDAT